MKTKIRLLLTLLSMFMFIGSFAQIPYVYTLENTDTGYTAPPLPTIANCPIVPLLPDPFRFANGSFGKTFSDWEHHRSDFKALIENYEIGTKPVVDTSKVTATYAAGTLTVKVTANGQTLTLTCAVSIPAGATPPYPICIGMNSPYGSITDSNFTNRGIVGITFSHDQVSSYSTPSNSDPFFKLYPDQNVDNTGQYAAWAWGVSRIIDGLYKVHSSFNADLNHICVTGCSYAGKMALFAGAFDERIALTIAQESGGGGATSWRYTNTLPAGTVEGIAQTNPAWFKNSMFDFSSPNVSKLPDDHHMLMAMCAPRALYCTGNSTQVWLSNMSNYVCDMATKNIYDTLGISDRFGFNIDGGHAHCVFPSDQEPDITYFLDKFVLADTTLSQVITTHPAEYDTIDYAHWYSEWGPIAATGVSINPDTLSISTGSTSQLTAIFVPSAATNKKVTWSSSDTTVAKVDSLGLLTAVANGTDTITVTTDDGGLTAISVITVSDLAVTGVSMDPVSASILKGAVLQLKATLTPLYPTNKNITWSTNNPAVATVTSTGLVMGVDTGKATITVTTEDGSFTATSAITVTPSSPLYINVGGPAVGSFVADSYFTGGSPYTNPNTITESQITSNAPPVAIFSTERYGSFVYAIPGRPVTVPQTVTMYFAETYVTGAGQRLFSMSINGKTVLSNFDIYASAGGMNKGIARSFTTMADSIGQVVINFVTITQSPKINGIAVMDSGSIINTGLSKPLKDNKDFVVYPNPVSGLLNVALPGSHSAISLYNIDGQQLLNMNTEEANITIDMTKYRSGIYFMQISNSDLSVMKKIIKQ